jgi:RimJ/RimL family protein N-acetyltransferase
MVFKDIKFILKNGQEAILRSPKEEDIESTLEYLKISAGETNYILRYPEECEKYTVETEKALFDQKNASTNEMMIMCIVDNKVVGNCEINFLKGIKTKHRAKVAIALISDFWNQGIGTKMFEEMLHIAEKNPNIMQVELEFVEGNTRARHLYEKMGFRIAGMRPNAIRLKDGTLLNEYIMIRKIKK